MFFFVGTNQQYQGLEEPNNIRIPTRNKPHMYCTTSSLQYTCIYDDDDDV